MTDSGAMLREILVSAARGRGVASVSVIERMGGEPETCWVPESGSEPAFLSYSITKTFIASLVLELCEENHLRLEDPLSRWFPRITRADRISLRHLLNHTAGIPDYGTLRTYHEGVRSSSSVPWTFERFAAETFEHGLQFEPGEGWAYSNPGYMLLKRILEEVTGYSFRDLVMERIARPFGLKRTFVAESISDLESLATGTSCALSVDRTPRDVREHYHPGWVSHGVIASTASDVVRFLDALFGGRMLSRHSLDEMMSMVPVPMTRELSESLAKSPFRTSAPSYGLGVMGDPASPWGPLVGHNGGGPCYSASAFHAADLGGASVCAMGAIEEDFSAEENVAGVLDWLSATRS
ncbi:MAG: serine hydrolase domain-containing protein [Gemmatimonadota bacterium]